MRNYFLQVQCIGLYIFEYMFLITYTQMRSFSKFIFQIFISLSAVLAASPPRATRPPAARHQGSRRAPPGLPPRATRAPAARHQGSHLPTPPDPSDIILTPFLSLLPSSPRDSCTQTLLESGLYLLY